MKKGRFYAVSTGPGAADLLTLRACEILRKCGAIFYPKSEKNSRAFQTISSIIAASDDGSCGKIGKELIPANFSMGGNEENVYEKTAEKICTILDSGADAAFVALGDVSLYSTAGKISAFVKKAGFETEFCPGVTSFTAAACCTGKMLIDGSESATIIPGDAWFEGEKSRLKKELSLSGTKIIMKAGRHWAEIIALIEEKGLLENSYLVSNTSLPNEKVLFGSEILSAGKDAGYFSVLIINV